MINKTINYSHTPTQFIDVDGVSYAYRSLGKQSDVPIVCLQHFTGTLDNWDPLIINGLANKRKVITIDNAGVGKSGGIVPDNVQEMGYNIIKIISKMGIGKCDLLGYSLGGFIAQSIADVKPGLVRKIILIGTAPQGARALHSFPKLIEKAFQLPPQEIPLFLFATNTKESRSRLRSALIRLKERTDDHDKETSWTGIQAQMIAVTRWGTDTPTINLTKMQQPVLIIQGSNDEMMDSATSLELFRQIPKSILIYYPDSAHGSFFQYPGLFVEHANSFLDHF